MTPRNRFSEADVRRAIRAAQKEGVSMAVEILPDGTIRLAPATPVLTDDDEEDGEIHKPNSESPTGWSNLQGKPVPAPAQHILGRRPRRP